MSFDVEEFVWTLKYGTLLHHQGAIDRIVHKFMYTRDYDLFARDLIVQTGSRDVVLESARIASLSRGDRSRPNPTPHPYRTRTRSLES